MEETSFDVAITSSLIEKSIVQNTISSIASDSVMAVAIDIEAHSQDSMENQFKEKCSVDSQSSMKRDVILIVDRSGSMQDQMSQLSESILQVYHALKSTDRIAIITFDDRIEIEVPLQLVPDCEMSVIKCAKEITARGGTNISDAIFKAIDLLADDNDLQKGKISEDKLVLMCLLSDGQPCGGITNTHELVTTAAAKMAGTLSSKNRVVFNSFGFGSNHASELLQSLTQITLFPGRYYYLQQDNDIPTSIGDCLGAVSQLVAYDLKIETFVVDENNQPLKHWKSQYFDGQLPVTAISEDSMENENENDNSKNRSSVSVGVLSAEEKQTFVMIIYSEENSTKEIPAKILVSFSWVTNDKKNEYKRIEFCFDKKNFSENSKMEVSENENPKEKSKENSDVYYHILTHILRIKTAILLQSMLDPALMNRIPEMEELHNLILEILEKIQQLDSESALRDEGILSAIERDVGETLEKIQSLGESFHHNAHFRNRLLQYANEHLQQRSVSSASQLSKLSPYCTPNQISMRMRFLYMNKTSGSNPSEEKGEVKMEEEGTSEMHLAKRKEMDEEICYVTLDNWRTCNLGLGLLVRPRTARERYKKLIPRVELVEDYVSSEAYNRGVRGMVRDMNSLLDRDDSELEDKHQTLKSSTRGRINAWLPLYINETNWKFAKSWAPSAFSIIATQFNDQFKCQQAIDVCSKLMVQTVVKCLIEDQRVSDRAIQMYCDVHRLLLQMTVEYPEIIQLANEKLKKFIEISSSRSRSLTPDLGDIIMYLTVTDNYSWSDLKEFYIQEAFRRSTLHMGHVIIPSYSSVDELLTMWMEKTQGGRVTMFNVFFMETVARPAGLTLKDIMNSYDLTWGKLPDETILKLKKGCESIIKVTKLPDVLKHIGVTMSNDAIAELILWSFDNKIEEKSRVYPPFPTKAGRSVQIWKERNKIWQIIKNSPVTELAYLPPPPVSKRLYPNEDSIVGPLIKKLKNANENSMENSMETSEFCVVECNCKRCLVQIEINKLRKLWKPVKSDPSCTVIVARLPYSVTEKTLRENMEDKGTVTSVTLVTDKMNGKSRGYAFVQFSNSQEAENAIGEIEIDDKKAIVDKVKSQDENFYPRRLAGGVGKGRN